MRSGHETRYAMRISALVALGLALSILESLLPLTLLLPLPGFKLGLANIAVLSAIALFGFRAGLTVSFLRVLLTWSIAGSPAMLLLGFAGAMASAVVMGLAWKYLHPRLSLIGISLLGAVVHNLGQLAMAHVVIIHNAGITLYLLPFLVLFALPPGFVNGWLASLTLPLAKERLQELEASERI